ncbi:MAG: hypothetical protein ACR2OI_07090 [Acidimicrobiia bacterium]
MDSYKPDLILDLAAGRLPEEEARAAEAALSPEGRAELAAQRAIMAAIADAPPVGMTDIERAHLHQTVAQGIAETTREMSAAAVPASAPARAPRRRTVLLTRFASAAAVAALFVGVVAVGSQLTFGGGEDADVSADFATIATTTPSALAAEARETTTTAQASFESDTAAGGDGGADAATDDDGLEESVAQLASAPTLSRTAEKEDLGEVTDWLIDATRDESLPTVQDLNALPCFAVAAEDDDLAVSHYFNVEYRSPAGEMLAGIAFADAGTTTDDPLIRVYDLATCEPVLANTD